MVRGLNLFRDHFAEHTHQYVIIGGAACDLAFSAVGLPFRVTKDLDIVLMVDSLDDAFGQTFWSFIEAGGYQHQATGDDGKRQFYRFSKPGNGNYPYMLELFSRAPIVTRPFSAGHLTPIPLGAASSLSAILLDENYYGVIQNGRNLVGGVTTLRPEALIPLKMAAWLDLSRKKNEGTPVDSGDIKKHRNDVFRLFSLLSEDTRVSVSAPVRADIQDFLARMRETPPDLNALGLSTFTPNGVFSALERIYAV
jgi:hypothetical protein